MIRHSFKFSAELREEVGDGMSSEQPISKIAVQSVLSGEAVNPHLGTLDSTVN